MGNGEFNVEGNPAMDWHPIQEGVEILIVVSFYGNQLQPDGPLGSYADFTFTKHFPKYKSILQSPFFTQDL